MDNLQKNVISIITAALTNNPSILSENFDLAAGINIAKKHNILNIFYEGAIKSGISSNEPLLLALYNDLVKNVVIDLHQTSAAKILMDIFESEGIDYLPLKGLILKPLYPKTEMRTMGDADILIKIEQYPKIESILEKNGYTFKYESDHELVWTCSSLFLELHKSVMTSYNKDFYGYFGTGWSLAQRISDGSSRYEFKNEDFYIYIFVHFTKHYRISGIGIKHILDLWVYKEAYPDMDWKYIIKILKQLHLYEFHSNILNVLNVWFNNKASDEKSDFITNVIFSSGQYGTFEMTNVNRAIRDSKNTGSIQKTKIKNFIATLFPSVSTLEKEYSVLKRLRILLPIIWVVRWFKIIIFKRKDIKHFVNNMKSIDEKTVNEHYSALQYVGLDFNFGE